jgi:hypothetical protein
MCERPQTRTLVPNSSPTGKGWASPARRSSSGAQPRPFTCAHRALGSRGWSDRLGGCEPAPPAHLKALLAPSLAAFRCRERGELPCFARSHGPSELLQIVRAEFELPLGSLSQHPFVRVATPGRAGHLRSLNVPTSRPGHSPALSSRSTDLYTVMTRSETHAHPIGRPLVEGRDAHGCGRSSKAERALGLRTNTTRPPMHEPLTRVSRVP